MNESKFGEIPTLTAGEVVPAEMAPIEGGQWRRATSALLGKQVRVKLDDQIVMVGKLLAFGDSGEFVVQDDNGFVHHCWPMLNIVEDRSGER